MRLIRKIFNFPNKEEEKRIKEKSDLIWELAAGRAKFLNKQIQDKSIQINDSCPKCESVAVINKFIMLQGEGRGLGHFTVDTNEINHCNNCGNQWKKYEIINVKPADVIASWMDDMYEHIYKGKKEFEDTKIREFNGFEIYAESISNVLYEVSDKCKYSYDIKSHLNTINLREKFKSVYDIKTDKK